MCGINLSLHLFDLALSGLKFSLCERAPDFVRRYVISPFQGWLNVSFPKVLVCTLNLSNGFFLKKNIGNRSNFRSPNFTSSNSEIGLVLKGRDLTVGYLPSTATTRQAQRSKSYEYSHDLVRIHATNNWLGLKWYFPIGFCMR